MGALACLKYRESKRCFLYSVVLFPSPRLGVGSKVASLRCRSVRRMLQGAQFGWGDTCV